ncbi:MAG: hypothetical protein M5R42_14150 [Rhodocyclaceae bacterium]|nr:hypothetical protein [Rhodocyclaceae bacterium]
MKLLSYFRGEAFQRGVHPPGFKHTADMPIRRLPFAPRLVVPLSQHIGRPSRPIVRVGEGGGARTADRRGRRLAVGAAARAGHRRGGGHRTAPERARAVDGMHRHPRV